MKNLNESYFRKLIKGYIPLYQTFWAWFICIALIIEIFFDMNLDHINYSNLTFSDSFSILIYSLSIIYSIFIFLAVFKSANNYKGNKIYSFISKSLVSIYLALNIYVTIDIFKFVFIKDYILNKQINSYQQQLPIIIDSYIKLNNIYKNDKTINYEYEFYGLDKSKDKIPNSYKLTRQIQESICIEENFDLLYEGYTFKYKYFDKKQNEILEVNTNLSSCPKSFNDINILKEILKTQ